MSHLVLNFKILGMSMKIVRDFLLQNNVNILVI